MQLILATHLLFASAVGAQQPSGRPRVGDTYEITLTRDWTQQGSDGFSSASSHDLDTVIERVIRVRGDGLELEYDLPASTPKDERSSTWQFPARVFRPFNGPVELLDRSGLERRVDAWLKAARLPRAACGHMIFTWNEFRIECNPDAVIKTVEAFEFPTDIHDGASYRDPGARIPTALIMKQMGPQGTTLVANAEIDPDAVRRNAAETDMGVGEILNKPLTLEAALAKHASDDISGTISVTFDTDASGQVWRRKTVTVVKIKKRDGQSDTQTTTTTLERHRLNG